MSNKVYPVYLSDVAALLKRKMTEGECERAEGLRGEGKSIEEIAASFKTEEKDIRYPYTYACDYLRGFGGYERMSRADASQILSATATAIGMPDEELARKLADHYLANEESITEQSTKRLLVALKLRPASEG